MSSRRSFSARPAPGSEGGRPETRVVIVGAGALGARTARLLVQRGYEVVVIGETDSSHADALLALNGNARTNLIASLIGRSLGFPRVITRIDDEEFEHTAIELGLLGTIIPARTIGRYLAEVVEGHDVLDLSGAIKGDARVLLFAVREEDEGTAAALCLVLLLLAVYWPPLAEVLSVTRPGPSGWTLAIVASLVPLVVGQLYLVPRLGPRGPRLAPLGAVR